MKTPEDYYIEKLESDDRINTFLWYFRLPKHPKTLIAFVVAPMLLVAHLINAWVPSALALVIAWNVSVAEKEKERVLCRCLGLEMLIQQEIDSGIAYGPNYVVEEDRSSILEDCIQRRERSVRRLLRMYWRDIVRITAFYAATYLVLFIF